MSLNVKNKRRILINVITVIVVTLLAVYYLTKSGLVTFESIKNIPIGIFPLWYFLFLLF